MKLIDNNFIEIESDISSELNLKINEIISFLKNIIDNNILDEVISDFDDIFIQYTNGQKFSITLPNGSKKEQIFPSNTGALKTNMKISLSDNELNIIPGIALRPNYTIHQFVHEFMHALSSKQHNYFNSLGVTYTKTGTNINYYDKDLNDYNGNEAISSDGLNEGITELLTSIFTNEYTGAYSPFVVAAELLNCDNMLFNAYFSRDINNLLNFYKDLEEHQDIITRNDLINLNSKEMDEDILKKIIIGAITYRLSYCNENNYKDTLQYIQNKLIYLDKSFILDNGSWLDLLENIEMNKKVL